eukprot:GEMP01028739.1.p1 GENE.GEMP01028739.1~~GEMP01028739.1.p1  ORF type:complete len:417 (+),score=34.34 GEMP01028739.1:96-1346(+)
MLRCIITMSYAFWFASAEVVPPPLRDRANQKYTDLGNNTECRKRGPAVSFPDSRRFFRVQHNDCRRGCSVNSMCGGYSWGPIATCNHWISDRSTLVGTPSVHLSGSRCFVKGVPCLSKRFSITNLKFTGDEIDLQGHDDPGISNPVDVYCDLTIRHGALTIFLDRTYTISQNARPDWGATSWDLNFETIDIRNDTFLTNSTFCIECYDDDIETRDDLVGVVNISWHQFDQEEAQTWTLQPIGPLRDNLDLNMEFETTCSAMCVHQECIDGEWVYDGIPQLPCSNPNNDPGGAWCPTSLDANNNYIEGSERLHCYPCGGMEFLCYGALVGLTDEDVLDIQWSEGSLDQCLTRCAQLPRCNLVMYSHTENCIAREVDTRPLSSNCDAATRHHTYWKPPPITTTATTQGARRLGAYTMI